MSNLIEVLDAQNVKSELPEIEVGSTVRVHIKIKDCLLYTSRCV